MKNHVYLERSKQVKLPDNRILAVELRAFAQTQFRPTEMMVMVMIMVMMMVMVKEEMLISLFHPNLAMFFILSTAVTALRCLVENIVVGKI